MSNFLQSGATADAKVLAFGYSRSPLTVHILAIFHGDEVDLAGSVIHLVHKAEVADAQAICTRRASKLYHSGRTRIVAQRPDARVHPIKY
jgi:hypothetical protein